jgi:deoxyribodipyrimidine photolyase
MIKQAKDYDPEGEYVRLWLPELAHLEPGSHGLFMPWETPGGLPKGYPTPIVIEPEWLKFCISSKQKSAGQGKQKRGSNWKVKRF